MLNCNTEFLPLMKLKKERHLFTLYFGNANYLQVKIEKDILTPIYNVFTYLKGKG